MAVCTISLFRDSLRRGPQLGLSIMYPGTGIIERIAPDWDWIWIDGQHGELAYADILAGVRACDFRDRPSVIRVPANEPGVIGRALDTGAAGVMVPLVENAEQARAAVEAARFPPLGQRSFGGRRAVDLYGRRYANDQDLRPLLICQIESPAALTRVDAVAAVEGVDALFFGADDMTLRRGLRMDEPVPDDFLDDALQAVAAAAASHGKIAGAVFTTTTRLQSGVKLGYRLIASGNDVGLVAQSSRDLARTLRQCCTNTQP